MSDQTIEEARECLEMWREGDYDNFKDAIMEFRDLLDELPESEATLRKEVRLVLIEATTDAQEMVDEDPSMADYMEGLIDPEFLSAEYKAGKK